MTTHYPVRCYGAWLHTLVCLRANRQQYFGTFFLRNRPALELMRRLAQQKVHGSTLRIAVVALQYRSGSLFNPLDHPLGRPDLKVTLYAVDISKEILNFAEKGIYATERSELVGAPIFERLTAREGGKCLIGTAIRPKSNRGSGKGSPGELGDAADPELIRDLGPQDIVVANNFLCHMAPADAEKCLRNIGQLSVSGGYIFVSGVDLDVRTKVARTSAGSRWRS